MHLLKTARGHIFFLILTSFYCSPSHAATITNLSGRPQTIEIECNCDSPYVTIAPGETWRVVGQVTIYFRGDAKHIDDKDEYAIWDNDELWPQRYDRSGKRH